MMSKRRHVIGKVVRKRENRNITPFLSLKSPTSKISSVVEVILFFRGELVLVLVGIVVVPDGSMIRRRMSGASTTGTVDARRSTHSLE